MKEPTAPTEVSATPPVPRTAIATAVARNLDPPVTLRPYQKDAFDHIIRWMLHSVEPACAELATGAGKSWIIAAVADWVLSFSGKRVMVIAPTGELVAQDHDKYLKLGREAGIFSATVGRKDVDALVTFGTPQSILRAKDAFTDSFGAVIIDEAHQITPTVRKIVARMRAVNPNLRVLGLTATPYRTGTGYIYRYEPNGQYVPDDQAVEPYFNSLVYRITAPELIELGWLTPVTTRVEDQHYAGASLQLNRKGQFDADDVQEVFENRGELTASIVQTIIDSTVDRHGVIVYAASVRAAKEILKLLPKRQSAMIGGTVNMSGKARKKLLEAFLARTIKYIVNIQTLTVGFDAPHVDAIAVLRSTESPGLLQQMIGRGVRLSPETGKRNCLFMDFAENVARHHLDENLFDPTVRVPKSDGEDAAYIPAKCPSCGYVNSFKARPNPANLEIDANGCFLDHAGKRIKTPYGDMPGHRGRRCHGRVKGARPGTFKECSYLWLSQECPSCGHRNDMMARCCTACGAELDDPEAKLTDIYSEASIDPLAERTEKVTAWEVSKHVSRSGRPALLVSWATQRGPVRIYYSPHYTPTWRVLCATVFGRGHVARSVDEFMQYVARGTAPATITYKRRKDSIYNLPVAYNRDAPAAEEANASTSTAPKHRRSAGATRTAATPAAAPATAAS
ncbi:MAG TPA: DEAD/DEAH box helicase [Nevskiaceae bacterium]|nr:DEAD/DEAH box helicase [Nevskiaceae bacterium]